MDSNSLETLTTGDLLDRAALLATADDAYDSDDFWAAVVALQRRPEPAVFDRTDEWCASTNARLRALGTSVLAQLGAPEWPFAAESTPIVQRLLRDLDEHVVVAAVFALGDLRAGSTPDSPEIRDALAVRLDDEDDEVRGEALVGLARRRDARAVAAIAAELARDDVSMLAIEAAEIMPSAEFVPALRALADRTPSHDIYRALERCEPARA